MNWTDKTVAKAGQLFAHYITQWAARRASARTIAALQSLLTIHENQLSCQELFLPNYRFDFVTRQILEAFDGTEETTCVLARILKQDQATVVHWAQLAGKMISVNMTGNESRDAQLDQFAETEPLPVVSEPKVKQPHFRWTVEMVEQLVAAFHAHEGTSVSAIAGEIASQNGWPLSAIKYKIYELKLPQQKHTAQEQERVGSLGADRREEISQDLSDHEPHLVLQQAENDEIVPADETAADGPQEEQVFRWDDEKVQRLTTAFMQSEAENTSGACREIAAQFGWPLTKVTNKVNYLHLPGHKLNRQRAASEALVPKIIRENELLIGHFVWRVLIDGNLTQWRLDYNYGNFPEDLLGAEIYYQGCLYLVEQIFVQELRVSTRIAQSADQGEMEVLPVSA